MEGIIIKVIGITGKSGSGKTTFASLLAKELKCKHIDIDKISHEDIFRPEILDESGKLDRKKWEILYLPRDIK